MDESVIFLGIFLTNALIFSIYRFSHIFYFIIWSIPISGIMYMYMCDTLIRVSNSLYFLISNLFPAYITFFINIVYNVDFNITFDLHLPGKFFEVFFNNVQYYRKNDFFCKCCIFPILPVKTITCRYSARTW